MAGWDKKLLWCFMLLLAGAAAQPVMYPPHVCAVSGSTVTLPCTFTPNNTFNGTGVEVRIQVIRVRWCQNHQICHGSTPNVYDSRSPNNNNHRYKYLGDLKKNCTLQIKNVNKMEDEATLRFRMEVNYTMGHFTGTSGVNVTITDRTKLKIVSSRDNRQVAEGQTVTLQCSANCTFNQLEVSWFRDGQLLSESGPALLLGPLTAEDSGNYTCTLKIKQHLLSEPYSLSVRDKEEGQHGDLPLIVGVVLGILLALIALIVVLLIIKRKRAAEKNQRAVGGEEPPRVPDEVYSNIVTFDPQGGGDLDMEDVSYASVQFQQQNQRRAPELSVIYSSVASRG
ncbi:uncharacterized protein [Labrus bergylta]|nr:uncharacterized protein LOC110004093 [Labrus bergylta]